MKETHPQRPVLAAITQLRAEIEALPMDSGGKRREISEDLRLRVAQALAESGMALSDFAQAVSVSSSAIFCWRQKWREQGHEKLKPAVLPPKPGFKRMTVTEEPAPHESRAAGSFTIEGPNGIRMTGLGAEDVARLWRALC